MNYQKVLKMRRLSFILIVIALCVIAFMFGAGHGLSNYEPKDLITVQQGQPLKLNVYPA